METANSKSGERPATSSPCWKKKEPDAGFLDDVKDHLGQFVSTSMDQHRICLKKSIRGISDYVKLRKQRKIIDTYFLKLQYIGQEGRNIEWCFLLGCSMRKGRSEVHFET
ncbi:hypothetical protein ZIOFF_015154 [Zingiber officinale]|uniref:Uncharacterized protein n=1 Tax=Zingiber officinale TaxID=94328 RepID=A0A8J5I174_ZINOF|nr:hypothetical protein ZIOFF_015154 [Zingiber officinale]